MCAAGLVSLKGVAGPGMFNRGKAAPSRSPEEVRGSPMRHAMLSLGACLALLAAAGPARPQDDTDRVVRGKKASEWMTVLRTDKDARSRRIALIALDIAGPQTRKVFDVVGATLRDDKDPAIRRGAALLIGKLGA